MGGSALLLSAALALIVALCLGWNTPTPLDPADWSAPHPPYRITATGGFGQPVVSLLAHPMSDFQFEVTATLLAGPDPSSYGLVYRAQDADHFYIFTVGSDGYYSVWQVDGTASTPLLPWQPFPHVRRGRSTNRLRVACAGPRCTFYVNDEFAAQVDDDRWLAGDVGLWARSDGDGELSVEYSAARVWE